MAWYDDKKRLTYVATYKNEKTFRRDVEQAAKHGFVPQAQTGQSQTQGGVIGAFGVVLGNFQTQQTVTVTYVRDAQWHASRAAGTRDDTLKSARNAFEGAERNVDRQGRQVQDALVKGRLYPEQLMTQMSLWTAVAGLIEARKKLVRRRGEFTNLVQPAVSAYEAEEDAARRRAEEAFLPIQGALVRALQAVAFAEARNKLTTMRLTGAEGAAVRAESAVEAAEGTGNPQADPPARGFFQRLGLAGPSDPQAAHAKATATLAKRQEAADDNHRKLEDARSAARAAAQARDDAIDSLGLIT